MAEKIIFCDIDGVVRNISGSIVFDRLGIENYVPDTYEWLLNGKNIFQLVAENPSILETAKPTIYYETIFEMAKTNYIIFLSVQPPEWRWPTSVWLNKHFGSIRYSAVYFHSSKDKLTYFEDRINAGIDGILIEDYPFTELPANIAKHIILIDYPYNTNADSTICRVKSTHELKEAVNGQ